MQLSSAKIRYRRLSSECRGISTWSRYMNSTDPAANSSDISKAAWQKVPGGLLPRLPPAIFKRLSRAILVLHLALILAAPAVLAAPGAERRHPWATVDTAKALQVDHSAWGDFLDTYVQSCRAPELSRLGLPGGFPRWRNTALSVFMVVRWKKRPSKQRGSMAPRPSHRRKFTNTPANGSHSRCAVFSQHVHSL